MSAARLTARDRLERRAAAVRRRPWVLWGGLAGVLVVVIGLGWLVLASPVLTVERVRVEGADPGDIEAVQTAAAAPMDVPLARADTGAMGDRVAALPFVRSVRVVRSWPHTLVVEVTPRVAVLAVKDPDGQVQLVDDQAVAFRSVAAAPAGIAVVNRAAQAPSRDGLLAAIAVLHTLSDAERATVKDLTVTSATLVTFTLGDVQVVWGGPGDEAKKLAVLHILLTKATPKPTVIDVSAPDTPVTR